MALETWEEAQDAIGILGDLSKAFDCVNYETLLLKLEHYGLAMDIAQRLELSIMEKQKPMNAVIGRGDSAVQQFYRGAVVFLTGGSGFLGKQLIEKLFRSCEIPKLYLLLRPKKGKTIEQRKTLILNDPFYDTLRQKKPNFSDSIVAVEGDVADIRVGLSDKDWDSITKETNIIIHMAATVNFDEPLHIAGMINVRGTREMLALGKQCANLKLFSHISTAFAHATGNRINTDVKEEFYSCPIAPDVFIDMVDSIDKDRLTNITPALIKGWPNTYTFTKAIAEELVRLEAGNLPICVVKPPVVINSFTEPTPGWMDTKTIMASPMGFLLGCGLGVAHVLLVDRSLVVSIAPVDYVNNAIIAAGWDSVQNRHLWDSIPIYTVSSSPYNTKWGTLADLVRSDEFFRLSTPKVLWYGYCIETKNTLVHWILTWFLHYLPGYFLDAVVDMLGVRPKGVPSLVKIYTKIYKLTSVYHYFMSNSWNFCNDNLVAMTARLSPADKAIYNCDVGTIDSKELMKACVVGIRRYVVKDGLQGSDAGYRKQQKLYYANLLFLTVYLYLIWRLVYFLYSTLAMIFAV